MKLTTQDVEALKGAFAACKVTGIDSVVIGDGMIRGAAADRNSAIISKIDLTIPQEYRLGLAKVADLEKRIALFGSVPSIELSVKDNNEVSLLTMVGGKMKAQLRGTSERLIKYPKSNADSARFTVTLSKAEAQSTVKALKTFGAERATLFVTAKSVRVECKDASNDTFTLELENPAIFEDEPDTFVTSYFMDNFTSVLDAIAKDEETIQLTIGEIGSITATVKGHTLVIIPVDTSGDD